MKLIIEAGATKSLWALITRSSIINQYHDVGFNISNQKLEELIIPKELFTQAAMINEVYFYGAGVLNERHKSLLSIYFREQLKQSSLACHIYDDMQALARASQDAGGCLLGILGTGSNVAHYDGTLIKAYSQNLGYILTDEGSGHALGKKIIKAYFYGEMPDDIATIFQQKYALDRVSFLKHLNGGNVNQAAYLASFTHFLNEINDRHSWKQSLLTGEIKNFFERKVNRLLKEYPSDILLLTGSIAYFFKDIVTQIAKEYGIIDTFIVANPMQELINYHQEQYD